MEDHKQPEVKVEQKDTPNQQHQKSHKKGEHKEKRPRQERKNQYEYNADIIDQNTVIPALPKKADIIPKPDINNYKARQAKNQQKIEKLIEKKKDIRAEKFKFQKKAHGEGDNKHSAFKVEISEVKQLRDKLSELKVERTELREKLHQRIEEAKANNQRIKQYKTALKGSRENFSERLEQAEHILITKSITKEEEKRLTDEIMLLKRKIRQAESSGNIEIKLQHCETRKEELDIEIDTIKKEKQPIEAEYDKIKAILDKKNEHITGLKSEINKEQTDKTEQKERHNQEYEKWKTEKKVRLEKAEQQIKRLREQNDKIWDQFYLKQQEWWKQKQYIDFIEWQNKVKARKIGEKEREAKRKQYEERDKQRQKEEQLKKYLSEIELCNFLINYLNNIRSEQTKKDEKQEVKLDPTQIKSKLSADSQWKKEKGLEVLQSKKSKIDEQPQKKHKKQKGKKEQKKQQPKFFIPYNVQGMFESLKLLAPSSPEQIDDKIKDLRERQALFERVCKEQSSEQQKKTAEQIKEKTNKTGKKEETKKKQQVKIEDDDFPSI